MALRATDDLTLSTRSAVVGQRVVVKAKVENSGAEDGRVALAAEGTSAPFAFEPAEVVVRAKSRSVVEFAWVAFLPEGKDALTFRGKLVLRHADSGKLVGESPLDVYVRRSP